MFNIIIYLYIYIYMYTTDNSQELLLNVALTVHARVEYFLRFETLEILVQVTVVQDSPYTLYRTICILWSDIISHNIGHLRHCLSQATTVEGWLILPSMCSDITESLQMAV